MQSLPILLNNLKRKGVTLSLSEENIVYRDPASILTQNDKDRLRDIRSELRLHLLAERAATTPFSNTDDRRIVPSPTQECWWNWVKHDPNLVSCERG
ncbi:MAG TPA: hypothetical protein VJ750_02375 [Rhizomicrobium sp.]|nr:hypothetical protein [Rhizomicrobium sp.]